MTLDCLNSIAVVFVVPAYTPYAGHVYHIRSIGRRWSFIRPLAWTLILGLLTMRISLQL